MIICRGQVDIGAPPPREISFQDWSPYPVTTPNIFLIGKPTDSVWRAFGARRSRAFSKKHL